MRRDGKSRERAPAFPMFTASKKCPRVTRASRCSMATCPTRRRRLCDRPIWKRIPSSIQVQDTVSPLAFPEEPFNLLSRTALLHVSHTPVSPVLAAPKHNRVFLFCLLMRFYTKRGRAASAVTDRVHEKTTTRLIFSST